jgi:hypothetical protein
MPRGPGPPCWARWSRRGAPTWHGCMPPAWLSALSPAGLGKSGGVLVTAGWLHAPRAAVWLLLPWTGLHDAWGPAPTPWGENQRACWRRLSPRRLRAQVGRVAFKRGATPLEGNHVFALPSCIVSSHLPSPRAGDARNPSVLSSGETQLRGSWYLSAIVRLQGFSSCSPTAPLRRRSPKTVTSSSMAGESKPGCGLCPSLSLKDFHH